MKFFHSLTLPARSATADWGIRLKRLRPTLKPEFNPVFVPLHSDVRDDVKRLKTETERFESALNQVSKWILDLPVRESECLPAARHILREVDALCDKALTTISAKGGAKSQFVDGNRSKAGQRDQQLWR